jgi:hypothetical protein
MDQAIGRSPHTESPAFPLPPFGAGLMWLLFLLVLPGLGDIMARLAPARAPVEPVASFRDFGFLAISLLIALPLIRISPPGFLMGLSDADTNVSFLALAGIVLGVGLWLTGRIHIARERLIISLSVAAICVLFIYALLGQVVSGLHGVGLTPEKALLTLLSTLCLLPFAFSFQSLFRRRHWGRALAARAGGRLMILLAVGVGNALGLFAFAGTIAFGMLLISYIIVEIVLTAYYANSENTLTGAGLEAMTVAWLLIVILPSSL